LRRLLGEGGGHGGEDEQWEKRAYEYAQGLLLHVISLLCRLDLLVFVDVGARSEPIRRLIGILSPCKEYNNYVFHQRIYKVDIGCEKA